MPPLPDQGGKPVGQLAGSGSLAKLDQLYLELRRQGLRPILVLDDAPGWASDHTSCGALAVSCRQKANAPHLPPSGGKPHRWREFAGALAARYPEAAIQPWNEPNIRPFWADTAPDPHRMYSMQCAAYQGVEAANPSATVLSAAVAVFVSPRSDGSPMFESYAETIYARGLESCIDALGLNLYPADATSLGAGSPLAARAGSSYPGC